MGKAPGEAVRIVGAAGWEWVRLFKEQVVQMIVDLSVTAALGQKRGAREEGEAPWSCPRCGPRRGDQLRRNGRYRRRPLVCEGSIALRVPQLLCTGCGRSVPFVHTLLPRRRRFWLDIDQRLTVLYLEGASYRGVKRQLEREARTSIGLMSLWRTLQRVAEEPHAPAERPPAVVMGLDEVHHRVKGKERWFLSARAQDAHGGKHWVGSVLSNDRSQDAWEAGLDELGISRYNPPFSLMSDGDQAIEGAIRQCLPGARLDRCTWHILHNAGEWLRERYPDKEHEDKRQGLMAACRSIINATTAPLRQHALAILAEDEPWLGHRLMRSLERVPLPGERPLRTNNIMERGFRELRRRTRQMDGFGSDRGARNFHTLWMLKENARVNGRDYLRELIP
jgi:transposase-like protein